MPIVFWIALALLSVVVLLQGFVMLELLRQVGDLRGRLADSNEPTPLQLESMGHRVDPEVILQSFAPETRARVLSELVGPAATGFVFLHPGCASCDTLASQLQGYLTTASGDRIVPIIGGRTEKEAMEFLQRSDLPPTSAFFDAGEFAYQLGVVARPSSVVVVDGAVVAAATVHSAEAVRRLLSSVHSKEAIGQRIDSHEIET